MTCAIATNNPGQGQWFCAPGDTGVGGQVIFKIDYVANTITVYRGTTSGTIIAGPTSLGTSLNRIANNFTPIQLAWKIHGSAGTLYARVGGVEFINLGSLNTQNTANTRWNRLNFHGQGAGLSLFSCDIGIWNMGGDAGNTLNLEYRTTYTPPTADNAVQFTRSTGANNWALVDETPFNSDTDYNSDTVAGHEDKFNISSSWVAAGATIYGVKTVRYSRIDDATPHTMKSRLYGSAAGVTDGATTTETSSYHLWEDRIDNDPGTSAPWTAANLQAAKPAYNLVS
jgi:hypothetical protein